MIQTTFPFIENCVIEQLELFPLEIYDNRVKRLRYGLEIQLAKFGWNPSDIDNLTACVKLFQVGYSEVVKQYENAIESQYKRIAKK